MSWLRGIFIFWPRGHFWSFKKLPLNPHMLFFLNWLIWFCGIRRLVFFTEIIIKFYVWPYTHVGWNSTLNRFGILHPPPFQATFFVSYLMRWSKSLCIISDSALPHQIWTKICLEPDSLSSNNIYEFWHKNKLSYSGIGLAFEQKWILLTKFSGMVWVIDLHVQLGFPWVSSRELWVSLEYRSLRPSQVKLCLN